MKEFLVVAEEAARQAGSFLLEQLNAKREIYYKGEGHKDPFSKADLGAEKIVLDTISSAFPEHSFLSEEGGGNENTSDYMWVVDPLDGTINYNHHYMHFAVSISLLHREDIIVGVIYNPCVDEMFSAVKGGGAYLNKEKMRVSAVSVLEESLIATAFPYDRKSEEFRKSERNFIRLLRDSQATRRAGSAALDLFNVACGRYDGFCVVGNKLWDCAAGIILVTEAGGKTTDFRGNPVSTSGDNNEVLATNGRIHDILLRIFQEEKTA